jgi:transaldolase
MKLADIRIDIYADGADIAAMRRLNADPLIRGLTTNPSLMRKAGITDYGAFAREVLSFVTEKPVSFEVFADDPPEVVRQARKIAAWGPNVYVKVPVVNSRGDPMWEPIEILSHDGVKVNVTAVMTTTQVHNLVKRLSTKTPAIVSLFAGRIADTGVGAGEIAANCRNLMRDNGWKLLWASCREPYNIAEAALAGCHIITVGDAILAKARAMYGMDLDALCLDTVRQFKRDSEGYAL